MVIAFKFHDWDMSRSFMFCKIISLVNNDCAVSVSTEDYININHILSSFNEGITVNA